MLIISHIKFYLFRKKNRFCPIFALIFQSQKKVSENSAFLLRGTFKNAKIKRHPLWFL